MCLNKTILLIAFTFPPFKSIGSRRWAKFAKYLANKGYIVYVIASENPHIQNGNWLKDINHPNINVTYLPHFYPKIIYNNNLSFFNRLRKKILHNLLSLCIHGYVGDVAIFWKFIINRKASELINTYNISNVICTGPPFRINYYCALLKEKFPNINIISDFRDVWLDGKVMGLDYLPERILYHEKKMEYYVYKNVNYLTFTDQAILEAAQNRYKDISKEKFILLPHAYDISDYSTENNTDKPYALNNKITFIFGGTIMSDCIEEVAVPFWKALCKLRIELPTIYNRLNFKFYHNNENFNKVLFSYNIGDVFETYVPISEDLFWIEVKKSDFCVSILADFLKDYITTKNISYLPFRKPIVMIANRGRAVDMILNNQLGYVLTPENCLEQIIEIVRDFDLNKIKFNLNYRIEQYSFLEVTKIIENLLV